jgi:hypothetical protein
MAQRKSFEEVVLEARAKERKVYARALADEKGPMAYGKTLSEDEQDDLWAHTEQQYVDPPFVADAVQHAAARYLGMGMKTDDATQRAVLEVASAYPQSAFLRLMVPKEMGGQGLTPLAASYTKYPNRQQLAEGSGDGGIDAQAAYAEHRQQRISKKQADQTAQPDQMSTPDTSTTMPPANVAAQQQPYGQEGV